MIYLTVTISQLSFKFVLVRVSFLSEMDIKSRQKVECYDILMLVA